MPEILRITHSNAGILFAVKVLPRSAKNMISDIHDGTLKIKLTATPVDGKANTALVSFLAKKLKISKNSIVIIKGTTSTHKQILLKTSAPSVAEKLQRISIR